MINPHHGARLTARQKAAGVAAAFGVFVRTRRKSTARFRAGVARRCPVAQSRPPALRDGSDRLLAQALQLLRSLRQSGAEIRASWACSTGPATVSRARAQAAAIAERAPSSSMSPSMTRRGRPMSRCWLTSAAVPRRPSCTARRWLRSHGIRVERVMTDNGSAYRSRHFAKVLRWLGICHVCTRPCTPKTNGMAERFFQKLLREWACGLARRASAAGNTDLPRRLDGFNRSRPHSALNGPEPRIRLNDLVRTHKHPRLTTMMPSWARRRSSQPAKPAGVERMRKP
jgi:hypothetical protein